MLSTYSGLESEIGHTNDGEREMECERKERKVEKSE